MIFIILYFLRPLNIKFFNTLLCCVCK